MLCCISFLEDVYTLGAKGLAGGLADGEISSASSPTHFFDETGGVLKPLLEFY